ncbi:MAG: zinc ribbon domain-containing protein, partial [Armatimonadota bacterium]
MPIYEYQCRKCKREFSFLYGMTKDSTDPRCPRCGSKRLARLVSRFASPRSEEDMLDSLEPSHLDPDNPKEVINWMKKLGKEMGEDADFADE